MQEAHKKNDDKGLKKIGLLKNRIVLRDAKWKILMEWYVLVDETYYNRD